MFLKHDITRRYGIFLSGDPIEVISKRDNVLIVKCNGQNIAIGFDDVSDVQIKKDKPIAPTKKLKR